MAQTVCYITNASNATLTMAGTFGTDWASSVPVGTSIAPGTQAMLIATMNDPGSDSTDHWGFVYLSNPGGADLQCFVLNDATNSIAAGAIGLKDCQSTWQNPNPQPYGDAYVNAANAADQSANSVTYTFF